MRPDNLYMAPVRTLPTTPLTPHATIHPQHPDLRVSFGQNTFNAEGQEARGHFFSRVMHWPGGASGVTIGRGYDMGQRTPLQAISELIHAGMGQSDAKTLSAAAGLRGEGANRFVTANLAESPLMSLPTQRRLFEVITTPEIVADIKRILAKPDLQAKYGAVSWDQLPRETQELVFDLRYRGDYKPETRQRIQPLLVSGDVSGLQELMEDKAYWRSHGVPTDRIYQRTNILNGSEGLREVG